MNAGYLTVMLEGKYTDGYLTAAGKDAPKFNDEDMKLIGAGGLRRHQRLPAERLRPGLRQGSGLAGGSAQRVAPEDVLDLALVRPGVSVLGAQVRAVALGGQGNLHHRERLRRGRQARRRRERVRYGSHHVPAELPDAAPAGGRQRRAGEGLLPVEPDGQLRVERGLRQPLWTRVRGLQDAEADPKAERGLLPGSRRPQRRGVGSRQRARRRTQRCSRRRPPSGFLEVARLPARPPLLSFAVWQQRQAERVAIERSQLMGAF